MGRRPARVPVTVPPRPGSGSQVLPVGSTTFTRGRRCTAPGTHMPPNGDGDVREFDCDGPYARVCDFGGSGVRGGGGIIDARARKKPAQPQYNTNTIQ
jgi:hypothetical protein